MRTNPDSFAPAQGEPTEPAAGPAAATPARNLLALGGGVLALAIGAFFLGAWLTVDPSQPDWHAWLALRMKTNASLTLVLLALALILLRRERARPLAHALAVGAALIAGLTLLQYGAGTDLGIDQLLARDFPTAESQRHPNRMAPNAAVALLAAAGALLALPSARRGWALLGQVAALLALAVCLLALVGYLYDAAIFYRPTQYVRMSPYTAAGITLVALGLVASRRDLGLARLMASPGPGGYLTRNLAVLAILAPVLLGWLRLESERRGLFGDNVGTTLLVMFTMVTFVLVIVVLGRSLDGVDARRREAEAGLAKTAQLTAALARAATVGEVVDVTVRLGLPAVGASSGAILLLSEDGQELTTGQAQGYAADVVQAFRSFPVASPLPAGEVVRTGAPVFVTSAAEYHARFPAVPPEMFAAHRSWAALPLQGRERLLGVLALSFANAETFPEALRERVMQVAWQCGQALDRAQLFDAARAARESAEAANRAKDEFLAMLGHELRNPLAPILTGLQLMKLREGGGVPGHQRERAVIERQVNHMVRLVDDLLDVSRITRGKIELKKKRIEVGDIVSKAVEIASPLFEERQHELRTHVAPGLAVSGDEHRLTQVLSNLLTNAAKYTNPGGVVTVTATGGDEEVTISVADTGVGITPELLPRVFELFVQDQRTPERTGGGLGLGLAISRRLVEMHGGRITADSPGPDRGSTFTVYLPHAAALPAAAPTPSPAPGRRGPRAGRRVLVVDDNRDAAEILAEAISLEGHEVRVAYDGPGALDVAAGLAPELAFLDIGLPVMDGYELARRLRAVVAGPLTLIAVTGYGQASDRARSAAAGFDEHLVKPIDLDRALAMIEGIPLAAAADRAG